MPESMTPAELAAECEAIAALLPAAITKSVSISAGWAAYSVDRTKPVHVYVSPGNDSKSEIFYGATYAEALSLAREWCATYQERRRERAEKKRAEAEAELAALAADQGAER